MALVGKLDALKKVLEEKVGQLVSLDEAEKKKLVETLVAEVASFLEKEVVEKVAEEAKEVAEVAKKSLGQLLMNLLACVSSKAVKQSVVEPQVVQPALQLRNTKEEETRPSKEVSAPSPQEEKK